MCSLLRVITVDEVVYFQSDAKYTKVVTPQLEALIRMPIKNLAEQLDPDEFIQVSRGAIISRRRIDAVVRRDGQMEVRMKGSKEVLGVSAGFQGQESFRQMWRRHATKWRFSRARFILNDRMLVL